MIIETAFTHLTTDKSYATVSTRDLFLAIRQSLLMEIAADERHYHDKRAAQYLQLGKLEDTLGLERTQVRKNGR